jgi:phenylpropionate dioxygenase-like ring-hydroxylating dioxygenase large terminal subunit
MTEPDRVPVERYYDRDFADREQRNLWSRAWQMACRLEELPDPGDYVEYVVGDQSVLVVRTAGDAGGPALAGYLNACRHRATELAKGSGSFPRGQIICPFHGWRWNLDGTSSSVYGEHAFDPELVNPAELCLHPVRVDTWGGCVWINLDADAPPLREALHPMPALLDPLGVADMRVVWWKSVVLAANWKMARRPSWRATTCPARTPS